MDANKLKRLKDINYQIKCCKTCQFADLKEFWGVCRKHSYRHLKHNETISALSISVFGCCNNYASILLLQNTGKEFHGFKELIL